MSTTPASATFVVLLTPVLLPLLPMLVVLPLLPMLVVLLLLMSCRGFVEVSGGAGCCCL
jgi:hypothetical protein